MYVLCTAHYGASDVYLYLFRLKEEPNSWLVIDALVYTLVCKKNVYTLECLEQFGFKICNISYRTSHV